MQRDFPFHFRISLDLLALNSPSQHIVVSLRLSEPLFGTGAKEWARSVLHLPWITLPVCLESGEPCQVSEHQTFIRAGVAWGV